MPTNINPSNQTITQYTVQVGGASNLLAPVGPGSSGQVLQSAGNAANPAYSTATYPSTAGTTGNVLASDGTNFVSSAPSAKTKVTTYTGSGSWTIDSKTVLAEFFVWGAGSGGGSGRCGVSATAGGGGGGACASFTHVVSLASQLTSSPYTVTIGAGGAGGISINAVTTNGNPGSLGGSTSVGTGIVSPAGTVGSGGTTSTASAGSALCVEKFYLASAIGGGSGGAAVGSASVVNYFGWGTGGGGGSGYTSATPRAGSAAGAIVDLTPTTLVAGGLAGANTGATAGNGNSPSGLSMIVGATGGGGAGHDGTLTAGTGGNGANPGGGGGGGAGQLSSNPSGTGGIGGNGQIIIIEYF